MSVSFTYTTLKDELQSFVEDDLGSIDTIIALGEVRLLRDLDLEFFDKTADGALSTGSQWLTKPTDMIGVRTMHYLGGSGWVLMEPKTWEYALDYWPDAASTTTAPKYFVDFSGEHWYIVGTPAGDYQVRVRYISRPDGLSADVPTTWLSTNAGDLLLMACLIESEGYLKADERVGVWRQNYIERVTAARSELRAYDRMNYTPLTKEAG